MTLKQMTYFLSVAKTNNLTKSAEELYISQPALSQTIRALEDEVGFSLFYKRGNRLFLTESGAVLQEDIEKVMAQYREMEDRIRSGAMNRNYIRLGFSSIVGNAVVPQLCGAFITRYPEITLRTTESVGTTLLHMLDNDQIDAVVTGGGYGDTHGWKGHFNEIQLKEVDFSYFVSTKSPLAKKETVTLDDVAAYPTIMLNDSFPIAVRQKERFRSFGKELNIILQTGQYYTVERFISEGVGGGFLPTQTGSNDPSITTVACPELTGFQSLFTMLYWKKSLPKYPSLNKFIEVAQDMMK